MIPFSSITKADLLETPFIPKLYVSYCEPYNAHTSLLKSESKSKLSDCSSLYLASEYKASVEIPNTFALIWLYHDISSRTEHSSRVQVDVNAKGKNSSNTR